MVLDLMTSSPLGGGVCIDTLVFPTSQPTNSETVIACHNECLIHHLPIHGQLYFIVGLKPYTLDT